MARTATWIFRCAPALLIFLTACTTGTTGGGLSVWVIGGDHHATPDDQPRVDEMVFDPDRKQISLSAAIDETVAIQVGMRGSIGLLGSVDVVVSELQGPGAAAIPAESVQRFVHELQNLRDFPSWYPGHAEQQAGEREVYDRLIPYEATRRGGPIRLRGGQAHYVWVDVHVPPGTPPGTYRGQLQVKQGGRALATHSLVLTVAPVALPSEPTMPLVLRCDPTEWLTEIMGWPTNTPETTRILPGTAGHTRAQRLMTGLLDELQQHRTTPLLWASFPKYRTTAPDAVEIEWDRYDELVAGWLDGSAFTSGLRTPLWPLPMSIEYPDARRNGGPGAAAYARLAGAYVREADKHFAEMGWSERALLRPLPPAAPTRRNAEAHRQLLAALDTDIPVVSHLAPQSLRGLGWQGAGDAPPDGVDIWAPPAGWLDPATISARQARGQQIWFQPDQPPYSPTLHIAGPAADATTIAWAAYRYGLDGIWIEHPFPSGGAEADAPLAYPGKEYGLPERLIPTVRLKRLRRGAADVELLRLLEEGGKPGLAKQTANEVVRWAFADACLENLLSTRPSGWSIDPRIVQTARMVMRRELAASFGAAVPNDLTGAWSRLLDGAERIDISARGTRLRDEDGALRASLFAQIDNASSRRIGGNWEIRDLPPGWSGDTSSSAQVSPNANTRREIDLQVEGLSYNADGLANFTLALTGSDVLLETPARVAVTTAPLLENPLDIDGDLSDWPITANNTAGGFQLVRGRDENGGMLPNLATRAYFCLDDDNLYVGVYCAKRSGERAYWKPDNTVGLDGAVPWGEDLVEILLHPANTSAGTGEQIYTLQVKPSGLLVAREGALTNPPMNPSKLWQSGVRVAAKESRVAWSLELVIPFENLGESAQRNRIWGVNVTRLDGRRGEYSSWSGARGYCYLPELLGNLILQRP